jgi:sterol desaturase/sphingolipid hydroxylase (fatty acid hydroxylase superfamily)
MELDWLIIAFVAGGAYFLLEAVFAWYCFGPPGTLTNRAQAWRFFFVNHFLGPPGLVLVAALYGFLLPTSALAVSGNPTVGAWIVQFMILFVWVEIAGYLIHRALHGSRIGWHLHRTHHRVPEVNWVTSSQVHILELLVFRVVGFLPIALFCPQQSVAVAYAAILSLHSMWIHTAGNPQPHRLTTVIVTPAVHAIHHSTETNEVASNFGVMTVLLDRLFGTFIAPKRHRDDSHSEKFHDVS